MSALTLTLPRLGETMDEATVVGWLVTPGTAFRRGQPIVELETDKTVVEYPALGDGVLDEILAESGDRIPVGAPLARATVADAGEWGEDGAGELDAAPEVAAAPAPEPPPASSVVEPAPVPASGVPASPTLVSAVPASPAPASPVPGDERRRATPVARRLAREAGIALDALPGTGRRGRIEARDVVAAGGRGRAAGAGLAPGFVTVPGGRIAFDVFGPDAGDGATILLMHGFSGDRRAWAAVAAILARAGQRVVVPDLPAHGGTEVEAADLASVEAAMAAFAGTLPGRLHLVGHSLGAVIATGLAARLGARVARLTLVTPVGCGREISGAFVTGMAAAQTPGEVSHLLRLLGPKGGGVSDAALAEMAAESARGRLVALAADFVGPLGQRADILRPLAALAKRLPVRALFGIDDRVVPATHALALPPQVAVHFLPTGHMPQWDAPAEVAALLGGSNSPAGGA